MTGSERLVGGTSNSATPAVGVSQCALIACLTLPIACSSPVPRPTLPNTPPSTPARVETVTCTAEEGALYEAISDGNFATGDVVRCTEVSTLSSVRVTERLAVAGLPGITSSSGAREVKLTYRTRRDETRAAFGTAYALIPDSPRATPVPIVVVGHGAAGLADRCAPSHHPTVSDYLALPWLAAGYAVIAPDYSGLGGEGVQGMGDSFDVAYSMLDAATALERLLAPTAAAHAIVLVGHSQGAAAALVAEGLAAAQTPPRAVAAVVAFAPALDLGGPLPIFDARGGGVTTLAALSFYSWFANEAGAANPGIASLHPDRREALEGVITGQCIFSLMLTLPRIAPTVRDALEPTFYASLDACEHGRACEGAGAQYIAWRAAQVSRFVSHGARTLIVQGQADELVPSSHAARVAEVLRTQGGAPDVCVVDAGHLDVAHRGASFAVEWVSAVREGGVVPECALTGVASLLHAAASR